MNSLRQILVMKTVPTILALTLWATPMLRAQIVADGATNTLNNVTNTFTGDVTVGTNGSFTLLVLSGNALLTNSLNGVIGRNVTAKSNEVRLISGSARWRMGNNLFVGSNGAFSRLIVSNGALVENFNGVLANTVAGSNNTVLVTGGGSVWSNRGDLAVGFSGRANQLIVSNGGFVFNRFGYLGQQPGGSNNVARVSGSGSVWSNQFYLTVGGNDRSNRLIVEAGGLVTCSDGIVSGSSSSGNNEVLVTGPGSLWSNRFFLFMGDVAGRNRLVVSNGATVWSGGGIVGTLSPALSNQVIVTGVGSMWTNESSLSLGESSPGNRVEVSDGGQLASVDGFVGLNAGANNNSVFLTGIGTIWNNLTNLVVGNSGAGNALIASNGAAILVGGRSVLGFNTAANSNSVFLTDPGTRLTVTDSFFVGSNGPSSRLTIANGGMASNNTATIGSQISSSNNLALVTGAGSVWSNRGFLTVGAVGSGNRLVISNGAMVANVVGGGVIGSSSSSNNEAVVTGPGSLWSIATNHLSVGSIASGNRLVISNGATVEISLGLAVIGSIGDRNEAMVTGPGSLWNIPNNTLHAGSIGHGNRLVISNGGLVRSFSALVGAIGTNNEALVTGAGSVWTNANDLRVGAARGQNRLVLSNGGAFHSTGAVTVGEQPDSTNNRVVVAAGTLQVTNAPGTGVLDVRRGTNVLNAGLIDVDRLVLTNTLGFFEFNGGTLVTRGAAISNGQPFIVGRSGATPAVWEVRAGASNHVLSVDLQVGNNSPSNQLVVGNGASLRNNQGVLGFNPSASNNLAVITGAGSVWSNASLLLVGNNSRGNRLVVSNGAAVKDSSGYVGLDGVGNNLAVVTGAGSLWTNSNDMFVGTFGAGNRLLVSDGAEVRNNYGFIGVDASASNNLAFVNGSGSVWSNALELYVGYSASGNQLVVSNGGSVFSTSKGFIGFNSTAVSNTALVTDPGSRWMGGLQSDFYIGSNSPFNRLIVTNGGMVADNDGFFGHETLGRSNLVLVTGAGSTWSNRFILEMGQRGSGNRMVISNGGLVFVTSFVRMGRITGAGNEVVVTGPGSALRIPFGGLRIGESAGGNRVEINNGAFVLTAGAEIGADTGANNEALVTGPGSLWTNASTLIVGLYGNRGRLIISNAATVIAGARLTIGEQTIATNNRVVVDGGALFVTNPAVNAVLEVRRGTNQFNAGLMDVDHLLLTNALGKFEFNGGTLITRGASISNGVPFIVGISGPIPALWDVRAGVGDHVLAVPLFVGFNSSFNQLFVTNGEPVRSASGEIGARSGSTNNQVVVTGNGSAWNNDSQIYVGTSGADNLLLVNNGGAVSNADGYIGGNAFASNNLALVTGAGSAWTSLGELHVGLNGVGNQLVVSNGGTVFTFANKYVGYNDGALSNTAIVTDPGSRWLGDDSLYVGSAGAFNRLLVLNGAQVVSGIGTLGGILGANSNQVVVADAGSMWTNQFELNVGESGSGNRLVVSNGGSLFVGTSGFMGRNSGANSNSVIVSGLGTRWLISSNLYVGSNGALNRLVISNGASVANAVGNLGFNGSSPSNLAEVTGAGSVWSNAFELHVGNSGGSNQLVIGNGGTVFAAGGSSIGFKNNANGNSATVTDAGTSYRLSGNFAVGDNGAFNRLIVTNGGQVLSSGNGIIGFNSGGRSNLTIVTGTGSLWSNAASVFVGYAGADNRMVVSNGAGVNNGSGFIGLASSSNVAVVTGSGSVWHNRSAISVGHFNGDNQLVVSNGGEVFSGNGVIVGVETNSLRNRVTVDGGTLRATNAFGNSFLDVRQGTNVLHSGLIEVNRLSLTNVLGDFEFNGGTLVSSGTAIGNGRVFNVGNGASAATFELRNGTHSFANNLIVANNASLVGNGTVLGNLTVQPGGTLAPGVSVGKLAFSNSPVLQGATIMELSKTGPVVTNDQVQVAGPLSYGGSLVVSNLGPDALAAGDRFTLFNASSYSGAFANIALPTLPVTLVWTNKLAVDGSIEVLPYVPPPVELTIQLSNGVLQVSWPTNGADYCLETSYDLSPPITWRTVSSGITTNGASFVFSLANVVAAPKQFFRLAFPCSAAPLTLSLQLSNNLVTVSWPSNQFRLETTYALTPPVTWQTLSNNITDSDGLRVLTITNDPGVTNQFFRLAFP